MERKKKKLLILYDWFYPGFRAGGPIQSLTNLAAAIASEFDIYVITSAFDLNSVDAYNRITINYWNDIFLPGCSKSIKIFYSARNTLNRTKLQRLFQEVLPEVIYLNGIFSYKYFLLPLMVTKKRLEVKVIVCPRGMLQKGALSGKAFKKKIYLTYLKLSGLLSHVCWHATTSEEANDIASHFPLHKKISIATNIPKSPYNSIDTIAKKTGKLNLVYLSLINEHKNLLLLLQMLKEVEADVSLDVYGPVVDELYWKECNALINQMSGKIKYKGLVEPANVQAVLSEYHCMILLTKGENFGHALYESLSVGRPVITSNFTPWENLFEKRAGVNVNIEDKADCVSKIDAFARMSQNEFTPLTIGAHELALNYYKNLDYQNKYNQLFG